MILNINKNHYKKQIYNETLKPQFYYYFDNVFSTFTIHKLSETTSYKMFL